MGYFDLGASAGGFDYTAAGRGVVASGPHFGPEKYALVTMGLSGAPAKSTVLPRDSAFSVYESLEGKVGIGNLAYLAVFTSNGFAMAEKVSPPQPPAPAADPLVGQSPINPYGAFSSIPGGLTVARSPEKTGGKKGSSRSTLSPGGAAKMASMTPWLVVGGVLAVAAAVYTRRKP